MARRKSINDINEQRANILRSAVRHYGANERGISILDRVNRTANRYNQNAIRSIGQYPLTRNQMDKKLSRRQYMGLANG